MRMGRTKIDSSPAVQDKVLEMNKRGATAREIAKEITEKYGMKISHMAVHNWLLRVNNSMGAVIGTDVELNNYTRDRLWDASKTLKKTTDVLDKLLEQANTTKDFKLKAIREIRETLKYLDETRREFKQIHLSQQQITVNLTAQANLSGYQALIDQLNELEKAGEIRILNPRLRRTNGINTEGNENANQDRHNEEASNQERQPGSDDQHSPGGNDSG